MPHDLIPLGTLPPGAVVLADAEIEAVRDHAKARLDPRLL